MSWCDIGVNLNDKRLFFVPVFERALAADVNHIIITGTSLEKSQQAILLAEQYPNHLWATAGVHPHDASQFTPQTIDDLRTLSKSTRVVAIGECGLDFNRNFSTPEQQCFAFEQQLKLACELGLPVFLHERDAFEVQIEYLTKYRNDLHVGVCHGSPVDLRQRERDLGLGLSRSLLTYDGGR